MSSSKTLAALERTPLHARHVAAGATMAPFAGFEMPLHYPAGVRAEHMAVRERCGLFDVSHMGQIETSGPGAFALLQRLLSNDVAKLAMGGAQYALICGQDGGVLDDLFSYLLPNGTYLTVTNAANHERDFAWFSEHVDGLDAHVVDRAKEHAMLALQGPTARALAQAGADRALPARMRCHELDLFGVPVLACGTGYTGEDGVELLTPPARVGALWDALVDAGAQPAGLAARDTLRLEACFHLYGNDMDERNNPIEAGLGWCCKEETSFVGAEAVERVRLEGPQQRLVAFRIEGPGIARAGNPIVGGGAVTSGTFSPCLHAGIGLAYVPAATAAIGTALEVDVRGKIRAAKVHHKPFVPHNSEKGSP